MLRTGTYISPFVQEFCRAAEGNGWDWEQEHAALQNGRPPNKATQPDAASPRR